MSPPERHSLPQLVFSCLMTQIHQLLWIFLVLVLIYG